MINQENENTSSLNSFHVPLPPASSSDKAPAREEDNMRRSSEKPQSPPMPPLDMTSEDYEWRILL